MKLSFRSLIAVCAVLAVLTGGSGLALSIYSTSTAANNSVALQTLLLNEHTASAKSAKQTKEEVTSLNKAVALLVSQQQFDHAQSVNSQKRLRAVIQQVEQHLDRTIKQAIQQAAQSTVRQLQH